MIRRSRVGRIPRIRHEDPELQRYFDSVSEWIESHDPAVRRGNRMDSLLTLREALRLGLVQRDENRVEGVAPRPAGSGAAGGPAPANIPPAVSGLRAAASPWVVALSWDDPARVYSNHGLTEVWRAPSSDFSGAARVGSIAGSSFPDSAPSGSTVYYWVRAVSETNVPGPYDSTDGLMVVVPEEPFDPIVLSQSDYDELDPPVEGQLYLIPEDDD